MATFKAPTGAKHDRCIDHVPHAYPRSGKLCIGPTIGRAGMIAFADEMAAKAAEHRTADLARVEAMHAAAPTAKARRLAGRPPEPVLASRLNDGMTVHACSATADHGGRIRVSFLLPARGCVSCGWKEPERPYVTTTNEYGRSDSSRLIGPFLAEMETRPELPAEAFQPRTDSGTTLAEQVARYLARRGRTIEPAADTYVAAVARTRKARVKAAPAAVEPEPIAPDPMTICNGCDAAPALPDSPAGYCADCERAAGEPEPAAEPSRCWQYLHTQGGTRRCMVEPDHHDGAHDYEPFITSMSGEVVPVAPEPVAEPVAVLAAAEIDAANRTDMAAYLAAVPSGRPTCERCGQSFRKSGNGLAWHVANRPDCAERRLSVVA